MDRVVLITGASRGIGLATAVAFASAGDSVVATMRDTAQSGPLKAAAAAAGVRVEVAELDVVSDESVEKAFADLVAAYGRIDVLVCNAGTGTHGTLEELTIEDLQRSLEVNYLGVARTTKAALPLMREAARGHLIAVTSVAGFLGQPFQDAYCAAKHAVEGMYEALAPVAAKLGIHTCIVEPGPVATDFSIRSGTATGTVDAIEPIKARYRETMAQGSGRAQSPEGVAEVILAIADDEDPPLRKQTSKFTSILAAKKLVDLSGRSVVEFTSSWLST